MADEVTPDVQPEKTTEPEVPKAETPVEPAPVLAGADVPSVNPTHINAFFQDVEDAKVAVANAQGKLDLAIAAYKAHPDYVKPKKAGRPKKTV